MMKNRNLTLVALLALTWLPVRAALTDLPVKAQSPNGRLEVAVSINAANQPVYSVSLDGKSIISESRMGFDGRLESPTGIAGYTEESVDETYTLPHGKRSTYRNHYNQVTVQYGPGTSRDLFIDFRVYDDAVAFRYRLTSGVMTTYSGDATEFNFTDFSQALCLSYSYDYTWYYYQHPWSELTGEKGYNEPVLVQRSSDNTCILITESAHYAQTSGNAIVRGDKEGSLRFLAMARSGANPETTIKYPFETPWRTLIIGTPTEIVESTVVQNLNPATKVKDTSWIRPGRVAWNWAGEDRKRTDDINIAKRYVDLAAHLGWEYVLIDEGWEGHFKLEDFVPYAESRGVGVLVWFNNNHFQNNYASCLTYFKSLEALGVKGVKIDFFDSDEQSVIAKYETLLRATAEAHLLVDFHGCTRPTGWERAYPHLMTMEAVLGGEFLLDQPHMNQADHASNLVVGRNVLGPMDFTPTKLAQCTGSLKTHSNTSENPNTTWSYQLALWTLFESGFQCLIDCPDNIIDSPIEPVLRQVPTAWDEIRCLEAVPTRYATIARRSGDDWYVATISKNQRSPRIPLTFLEPGKEYIAYIYRDGNCTFDIAYERRKVTSESIISFSVLPNGGATIILTTDANRPYLRTVSYEAETLSSGTSQSSPHCSGGTYKSGFKGSTRALFRNVKVDVAGEYALTIYYMLPEQSRKAYVQVGADGEKQYYDFHVRDDYDRQKGLVMGMKTVYVQLEAGTNRILYGCDDDLAPDLDKITVTPTWETQQIANGVEEIRASGNQNERTLKLDGDYIVCSTLAPGTLTFFDAEGHKLQTIKVATGETRIKAPARGLIVASLNVNARAFARKFIIK